jgi:hypothetical protein
MKSIAPAVIVKSSRREVSRYEGILPMAQPYAPSISPRRGGIVGFFRDILRGALLGDFAMDLGLAGAVTQVALAYTPVVGDICALRDMAGDIYHRDKVGFLLSMMALVPVLGGIAKTIDVIHNTRRVGQAYVRSRQSRQVARASY